MTTHARDSGVFDPSETRWAPCQGPSQATNPLRFGGPVGNFVGGITLVVETSENYKVKVTVMRLPPLTPSFQFLEGTLDTECGH